MFWFLTRSKEGFAWGTFVSGIVWLLLSLNDYREVRLGGKTYLYLILSCGLYFICGMNSHTGIAFAAYVAGIVILMTALEKNELRSIGIYLQKLIEKTRKRS